MKLNLSELQALPAEELVALYGKMAEVAEAKRYKTLDSYLETAHAGQLDFHKADKRWRMVFSGNRWGKSTAGMVELIWMLTGTHPYKRTRVPLKGLLVATDFENHVKNVLEPKLIQWAPKGSIQKIEKNQQGAMRKVTFTCGSVLDVLSQDQALMVFEASDIDVCWIDEPCKQVIFNAIWRGLTDRAGSIWLTGTPLTEPWLYQEFKRAQEGDPLRWAIYGNTNDNALNIGEGNVELGKKRIEEMASMYDPEERAARLEGQFLTMHGLIFKQWEKAHHLITPFKWPSHWPIWESIDPHPRKPWAVSWIGIAEDGTKVLIKSGLFDGVIDEVAAEIIQTRANLGIEHDKRPRIVRTLIDNYASAPLMSRSNTDPTARRKSIREELEDLIGPNGAGGPSVTCAPKDVSQKIEITKQWLRIEETANGPRAQFYVFDVPENEQFVYEVENYVWDARRGSVRNGLKDSPKKIDDDVLDTVMQVALTLKKTDEGQSVAQPVSAVRSYGTYGGRDNGANANDRQRRSPFRAA